MRNFVVVSDSERTALHHVLFSEHPAGFDQRAKLIHHGFSAGRHLARVVQTMTCPMGRKKVMVWGDQGK